MTYTKDVISLETFKHRKKRNYRKGIFGVIEYILDKLTGGIFLLFVFPLLTFITIQQILDFDKGNLPLNWRELGWGENDNLYRGKIK